MSDKVFTIVEPRRGKNSLSAHMQKCYIWDYITAREYFKRDEFLGTYDECKKYRSELADMFRSLADDIEKCEIEEETREHILKDKDKPISRRGYSFCTEEDYKNWYMKTYGTLRTYKFLKDLEDEYKSDNKYHKE